FPASEVEILDTWNVLGLRGTGSHDIRVTKALCPQVRTCGLSDAVPDRGVAAMRITPRDQGGLVIAATACGVAAGALDALTLLASGGKRPAFSPRRLAQSPVFQDQLGETYMSLRAAQALLTTEVELAEAAVTEGQAPESLLRHRLRATGPRVIALATSVIDDAHRLGGGSAVYDCSPLQRRLRDGHTVTQHFSAGRDFYAPLGGLLAGEDVDQGMF
ncbi:MAG: acyl-CoA dehydrogenase family protein, partial [Candidatus Limnocylindria bacterium]